MNKSSLGTIFAVCIPLACAIIFGLLCLSQYKQREMARTDEAQHQKQVDSLNDMMRTVSIEPLANKDLAFEDTAEEQAQFLTQLRMDAQSAGIKLVQYTNMGQVLAGRPDPNDKNAQPSTYRPVASTLTVQGPYDGVKAFAYSLLRSRRLMNMNGVSWKRDPDGQTTTLSFTLIRYVTNPVTTATTRVAMAEPGSVGGAIR